MNDPMTRPLALALACSRACHSRRFSLSFLPAPLDGFSCSYPLHLVVEEWQF